MMVVSSFGLSDPGRVRDHNEDAFLINDSLRLYGVADGLGGMQAGEIASQFALHELQMFIHSHARAPAEERDELMARAFSRINQDIIRISRRRRDHRGMSTTLTACWLSEFTAHFLHAGDSAVFLMRKKRLRKITREHTLGAALKRELEAVFEPKHKLRIWDNVLIHCLGYSLSDKPDVMRVKLQPDDTLLLSTDGLLRHLNRAEISKILEASRDLPGAARQLVDAANSRGGVDNITVVLVKIKDSGPDNPALERQRPRGEWWL